MPKKVGLAMRVPEGASVADFDASGGVGAVAGVTSKLARQGTPQMIELLQDLLGVPLQHAANPKTLLRISSVEPQQGIARLHTNTGERVLSTITDLVKAIRDGVLEETGYLKPSQLGKLETAGEAGGTLYGGAERIPQVTVFGPKGGQQVTRRPIPPKATR